MPGGLELVAEPGALAAGVLAGADGGALDGLGEGEPAVEVGQGFGVADAAEGGKGSVITLVAEPAGFVQQALMEHAGGALGDALSQRRGFDLQAEDVSRNGRVRLGLVFRRPALPLDLRDFEGADEASGVVEVDGGGAIGREVAQAPDEGLGAIGLEFAG